MKRFLKLVCLFLSPFILLLTVYLFIDPFRVLFSKNIGPGSPNRDHVSTTTFELNYNKYHYNSFVLGNSRTLFYQISEWKKYLNSNASCFHFDASGESLYAIHKKILFLNKKNVNISNILLVLDYETLKQDIPKAGLVFAISPHLENNRNLLSFHLQYFKSFISPSNLFDFAKRLYLKEPNPFASKNKLADGRLINYDKSTNEIRFDAFEDSILKGKYYNEERIKLFYSRKAEEIFSPVSISTTQIKLLKEIIYILKKHKTDYKLIVSPLYDQMKLNHNDLKILNHIFGANKVFDFSGINSITNDYRNYYESSHYRPCAANEVLRVVYNDKKIP